MIALIGIGNFCSQIVNSFAKYPQYTIYNICTQKFNDKTNIIPVFKNAEEYEKNYPLALNNIIEENIEEIGRAHV